MLMRQFLSLLKVYHKRAAIAETSWDIEKHDGRLPIDVLSIFWIVALFLLVLGKTMYTNELSS